MNFEFLLLDLILTVALYCALPLLIASLKKNPVKEKSYRTTCFLSNIAVLFILYFIVGAFHTAPYVIWTLVFSGVGKNILKKRGLLIEDNAPEKLIVTPEMHKFVCTKCNALHTGWYNECPNCKAKGTIKRGSDEDIRKWNKLLESAPSVEPVTATNPQATTATISPLVTTSSGS